MYCAINEAFDNNNNDYNNDHNVYSKFNKYIRDKQPLSNNTNNNNFTGTTINDLHNSPTKDIDVISFPNTIDSNIVNDENIITKSRLKRPKDHRYYVTIFMKLISSESDGSSLSSDSFLNDNNDDVFEHVKLCRKCRREINKRIKDKSGNLSTVASKKRNPPVVEHFSPDVNNYNIKEILLIILSGIILIFVLDLIIRIGKKVSK